MDAHRILHHRYPDARTHDLVRIVADWGPLAADYLAAEEMRERALAAVKPTVSPPRAGLAVASPVRARMGAALVAIGRRLRGARPIEPPADIAAGSLRCAQ